jgi:hypothetical protein
MMDLKRTEVSNLNASSLAQAGSDGIKDSLGTLFNVSQPQMWLSSC